MLGEAEVKGEWVERIIIGLSTVRETVVMLGMPDGQTTLELVKFHSPSDEKRIQQSSANTIGSQHIAFAVEDIQAIVTELKKKGAELFGDKKITKTLINYAMFAGRKELL